MTDLRGDVELGTSADPERYPLERVEGKLSYVAKTVNDQATLNEIARHLPVEASWPHGTPGGMGEVFRTSPDSLGYMRSYNTDHTKLGYVRVRSSAVTLGSATTNSPTDIPTFSFEATDGTTQFIYFFNGRYGYKFSSDGSTIANETEKDFGASAVCGKPAKFNGVWYIPLGASVDAVKLTTIAATTAGADTYTTITGEKHNHFAASAQGAVQVLNFADADKVGVSTDGATFPSAQFECGDSGTDISNLAEGASGLFVAKKNNLGRLISGIWQQLTRFNEGDADDDYGVGLLVPGGSDAAYYNHGGVLSFFDGLDVDDASPEASPTIQNFSQGFGPIQGLSFRESAYGSDDWIYHAISMSAGGNPSGDEVLALRRGGGRHVWYSFWKHGANTGAVRGLIVDSSHRLWFFDVSNDKTVHVQLGTNNQPYAASDTGKGEGGVGALVYSAATNFGFPGVKKQLRAIEATAYGLDANNTLSLGYVTPLATATLGAAATANGLVSRKASTAVEFYDVSFIVTLVANGSNDPRYSSLTGYASLRPDKAVRHVFAIDTRRKYADGSQPEWDGPGALSNLRALERGVPTKFRDTGGAQDDAMVNSVTIRETFVDAARTDYLLDLVVTSWEI